MKIKYLFIFFGLVLFSCNVNEGEVIEIPDLDARIKAGGGTTIDELGAFSFDNPAPNLNAKNLEAHLRGDALFEQQFVSRPSPVFPGLGIQFNNNSCDGCHPKDGRAAFPKKINSLSGFFLRTSIPGEGKHGNPLPVPGFGDQIQNHALLGYEEEALFAVTYEDIPVKFKDGTEVILKKPIYSIEKSYIPFPANAMFSPRIAPPVIGLGLLDAIPEEDILAKEDINDADGDGISGKANWVWDLEFGKKRLGRFGWKANASSVMMQSAAAFNGDMGITSPLLPIESDYGQTNGAQAINENPDIDQQTLDDIVLYCRTLAVPAARDLDDPVVMRGYELFNKAKCTSCHTPKQRTGNFPGIPAISNQTIYPYTDMLLHDMGENLADHRPDCLANGYEWKTRQLWGIGLTKIVNGHMNLLHDGRAKSVEEAILFHGGEAQKSQEYYRNLSKSDRDALVKFVKSL